MSNILETVTGQQKNKLLSNKNKSISGAQWTFKEAYKFTSSVKKGDER
jgi:hypothetical protein